jgi:LmbE family N-acetylglucosaminyl deacetylase
MKPPTSVFLFACLLFPSLAARGQTAAPAAAPDPRYKVDILVVVAHPDDDIEVAAYSAKAIEQGKRVAVVYATRGNSGGNAAGQEQAKALADVREIEARQSLASYGITLAWFLHGSDTPGADVLHSLEQWGHGKALEEIVRTVRLTRPELIFTWLPDYDVGENHEDHQAAGVLATEAFDLAANPLAFPEQVEAPRDRWNISNYGEGLRPWQPKKIYYFSDATHSDFYAGNGPQYRTDEVSPSRKIPYSRVAAEAWSFYKTQNDFSAAQLKEFTETPVRLIFGKSLVGGSVTGDVFEGIRPGPISYARARGYEIPARQLSFELGGPWAFYREFWRAHDIERLEQLYPPEAQVAPGGTLWVPLLIRNNTDSEATVELRASLPDGWTQHPNDAKYPLAAHDSYPVQLTIKAPETEKGTWISLRWIASSGGQEVGSATLRVYLGSNGLPQ